MLALAPNRAVTTQDRHDPLLSAPLIDNDDPKNISFRILADPPNLAACTTEQLDPIRAKSRILKLLPQSAMSKTEILPHKCIELRTVMEDPNLAKLLIDRPLPTMR
jgi:hypothetical protein